jgi:quercetin dioxygenase-like cupin family protein
MATQKPMADDDATEAVFAALAEAVTPNELGQDQRDRMRRRIGERIAVTAPPSGTQTFSSQGEGWLTSSEFIQMKMLRVDEADGTQELLVRFLPGVAVPAHSHLKEEQMIIIEGECHIGEHPLRAGDVHIAPAGSWHPVITSKTGTLLLLRCEYPFPTDAGG